MQTFLRHGFQPESVIGGYPNASSRRILAEEWKRLSDEARIELRATRSKRGILCHVCGLAGYFRENCLNGCITPSSSDSEDDGFGTRQGSKKTLTEAEKRARRREKGIHKRQEDTANSADKSQLSLGHYSSRSRSRSRSRSPDITTLTKGISIPSIKPDSPDNSSTYESFAKDSVGVFWGSSATESKLSKKTAEVEKKTLFQIKQRPDVVELRRQTIKAKEELRENDQKLDGRFSFYKDAEPSYSRNVAELTLHQVLRRVMRLLEKQLIQNAEKLEATHDTSLLAPPVDKVGKTFFPEEFMSNKEYRDYFFDKESKKFRKLQYKNQVSLRPDDDIDSVFRGGTLVNDHLYKVKPNAGESIHAKNNWKSVLARNDLLASSDPSLIKKQEKLDKLFSDQGKWIRNQQKSMGFRNDRYEHMVFILRSELKKEHQRENKLLLAEKQEEKVAAFDLWRDRLVSVDTVINTLHSYNLIAGSEEADFLLYCLNSWREASRVKVTVGSSGAGGGGESSSSAVAIAAKTETMSKAATKGSGPKKANSSSLSRNLIAESASPYFQDSEFLEEMKRKQEKQYNLGKTGRVFTASGRRQEEEEKAKRKAARQEAIQQATVSIGAFSTSDGKEKIPDLNEALELAKKHTEKVEEREERIRKGRELVAALKPKDNFVTKPFVHPRVKDQIRIRAREDAFKMAGLKNRIRKGKDDDLAAVLPALIPIPKAFDGDNPMKSYTGQNIVFQLKKDMVLSDLGYTPQTVVPLYVRTTLYEKEGTSKDGDPTQEELALDRRYSHYVGRPLIRFNPTEKADKLSHSKGGEEVLLDDGFNSNRGQEAQPLVEDLTALSFSKDLNITSHSHFQLNTSANTNEKRLTKEERRLRRKAIEDRKLNPLSVSMVRMVFQNPEPTLADLKHLDDIF